MPAQLITTDANGVPNKSTLSFVPVREQAKALVNLAIGGHYAVSNAFRIHAAFFTDGSPVEHADSSDFRTIDLVGASAGVSFGGGHLTGSLGVSTSWGTTDSRAVGPSLGGVQAQPRLKVSTFNLLYAISYKF